MLQKIYTKYNVSIKPSLYKIEIIFCKKKDNRCDYAREQFDRLKRVLLLLRLFKTSDFRMYDEKIKELQWVPDPARGRYQLEDADISFTEHISCARSRNEYRLSKSETPKLIKLWKKLENIDLTSPAFLAIAIRRFIFVHERKNLEDKLIDIMVGFEALFLYGNSNKSYNMSRRAAILMGGTISQRAQAFEILRAGYNQRSRLLHGDINNLDLYIKVKRIKSKKNPEGRKFPAKVFIDILKRYQSCSIQKFICLATIPTKKQAIKDIDNNVFKRNKTVKNSRE
jgi:hypothetical protein